MSQSRYYSASDAELSRFMDRFRYEHPQKGGNINLGDQWRNGVKVDDTYFLRTNKVPWDIMIQQQQLIDKLEERCNSLEEKIDELDCNKRRSRGPRPRTSSEITKK